MKKTIALLSLFAPAFVFAQATNVVATDFVSLLQKVTYYLNLLIPFIIGLAVLVIMYGVLGYVMNAGNEEKRGEARSFIIWGIVGVFIMVSVWGLVGILKNSFGFSDAPILPSTQQVPFRP